MTSRTPSPRSLTLVSEPSSPASLTTSPASLAALQATAGQPIADMIETVTEEAHRMSIPDLRVCAQAFRLMAQAFEDEADLRLG